ncbi:ATP-binding cassette domain-containing protein [Clostridium cibarium]|uniref:ATP-binding cassette domain-containing protein n=1 Tax=Clostridium cibarium TaxID=2762247 RepID=A0ABR8PYD2_9CLOT|nr:ATP-binding cassette domain-containing protein [Clostridium cibarium]MBD7913147.1 ATP-binding cassette domain-containing protein [Clostridium cibarium]
MSYIEIKNLSKVLKGTTVLSKVNLQLEKGKIYGFIGRNGSGKTMLFRAICGLIRPTEGKILIDGKELNEDISFPESVGVIIENPGFWGNYTAYENLKILSSIKNIIDDEQINSQLSRIGLDQYKKLKYKKFSLGMKQKLAIVQAIMEKPDLIVLDEPTNALDEESCNLVREMILEEKRRGATILVASHNSDDINILADKKFKIDNGLVSEIVAN